ncbi:hypothetical protein QUF80_03325 [Desulfococcaceae bacterium HSG8]|nr:hypothetical protein [Desulfococcaceae bacterium HSG8]
MWVAWILIAGCWVLAAGCWLMDISYWLPFAGCWLLFAGYCFREHRLSDAPGFRHPGEKGEIS